MFHELRLVLLLERRDVDHAVVLVLITFAGLRDSAAAALAVAVSDCHPEGVATRCDTANGRRFRVSDVNRSNDASGLGIALRHGCIDVVRLPHGACANGEAVWPSATDRQAPDHLSFGGIELEQLLVVAPGVAGAARQHPDFAVANGDRGTGWSCRVGWARRTSRGPKRTSGAPRSLG